MNRRTLISRLVNTILYIVGPLTGLLLGISSTMILFSGLSIGANGIQGEIIEGLIRVFSVALGMFLFAIGITLPASSTRKLIPKNLINSPRLRLFTGMVLGGMGFGMVYICVIMN